MFYLRASLLLSISLVSLSIFAAEVRFPFGKTMTVNINSETLLSRESLLIEVFIPELKDDFQGAHHGGRISSEAHFSNAKFIVYLLLQEALRSKNTLEAKVEIATEMRRVYEYQCRCGSNGCPFGVREGCKPTDKYRDHIFEKVTVDIFGFKFVSVEDLTLESDQL
jgi:hypothetical protein